MNESSKAQFDILLLLKLSPSYSMFILVISYWFHITGHAPSDRLILSFILSLFFFSVAIFLCAPCTFRRFTLSTVDANNFPALFFFLISGPNFPAQFNQPIHPCYC